MQRSQVLPPPTTPQSARLHLINILRLTTLSLVSNGEVMKRVAAIKTALIGAHRQNTLTSPFFTLSPCAMSEGPTNLTEHSCAPSHQRESALTDADNRPTPGDIGRIGSGTGYSVGSIKRCANGTNGIQNRGVQANDGTCAFESIECTGGWVG
jgi:hypothetical protein